MKRASSFALIVSLLALLAGCQSSATVPLPLAAEYRLERVGTQPLPFALSRSSFRTIEIVYATLELEGRTTASGQVRYVTVVRVTDAGQPPREETSEARGTYTVRGRVLRAAFQNGSRVELAVEEDGNRLRQVGGSCGVEGCVDILHELIFRRGPVLL